MPTGTLPKLIGAPSRDARRASPGPLPGDGGSPRWTSETRSTWPDRRTLPSVAKTAVNLRFSPSKPISTCATARAMAPPAPSSPGKASMTVPPPAAAAGPLWGTPAVWSVTSSSIKVITQALSPNASDFFNSLLSGSLSSWHEPWAMPTDRTADRGAGSCANQATAGQDGVEPLATRAGGQSLSDSPPERAGFEPLIPLVFTVSETGRALPERLSRAGQACPAGGSGGAWGNL